jgi:hypothetical protein
MSEKVWDKLSVNLALPVSLVLVCLAIAVVVLR